MTLDRRHAWERPHLAGEFLQTHHMPAGTSESSGRVELSIAYCSLFSEPCPGSAGILPVSWTTPRLAGRAAGALGLGWLKPGLHATRKAAVLCLVIVALAWANGSRGDQEPSSLESPQDPARTNGEPRRVFKDRVTPHWFRENTRFWYRNDLRDGAKEFILVDAQRGTRALAFDHARLAKALSKAVGLKYQADRFPFDRIEFLETTNAIRFKVEASTWLCRLDSYECSKTEGVVGDQADEESETTRDRQRRSPGEDEAEDTEHAHSPDGKWSASVKDQNVFLKPLEGDAPEIQLSSDGKEGMAYGAISWSPDSKTLAAFRLEPGARQEVYLIESSPPGGGRAKLQTRPYALPGDKFTTFELNLFDVASRKQIKPDVARFEHEWLRPRLHWKADGRHAMYQQVDRGHQRLRLIEVDAHTAATRNLIDEKTDTFIWTAHTENLNLRLINWLTNTDEVIYVCESNGWRHLYLIDTQAGKLKNAITSGSWVVRGIERIDEVNRQVWFQASGVFPDQDPYLLHHARVNFDGRDLVFLTASNGNHTIHYSPDRKFIIDIYSRVDLAPVTELRRVADGQQVCALEQADVSELKAGGWEPPEVFVAKGRDGKTDIWGILCRPRHFDPDAKYPVIEDIYAGPQSSYVPKTFSARLRYESLTRLGFIVAKVDGMGTANRSKAFHDVCWKNLKDAGFPDRILWHQAVARKYPYYDISRVGIYGTSAGGQSAAGALLFHPDFYTAAVANCGCHDNRMDKASWNEQWMGYPVGPPYAESSNIDNAYRLRGRLLLVVGELDQNVPPESTFRLVDALIKANKDFELLVVPGGGHGAGGAYAERRLQDFFVRHLLRRDPPNRNVDP